MKSVVYAQEINAKLHRVMEDPDSKIEELCEVISSNSMLMVAVLEIANRPFFGFSGQIDNISSAANLLGMGQLYEIALNATDQSHFEITLDFEYLASMPAKSTVGVASLKTAPDADAILVN